MDVQPDRMRMHGFWTMTRTLLDEVLGFRPDFIQHQLAHVVRDPLGRAYNRTARLPQRREMMQEWADYLDFLKSDTRPNTRLLDHESLISRSEPKSKKSNCLTYRVHRCSRAGKRSRTQGQAKPSAASSPTFSPVFDFGAVDQFRMDLGRGDMALGSGSEQRLGQDHQIRG